MYGRNAQIAKALCPNRKGQRHKSGLYQFYMEVQNEGLVYF